MRPIPEKCEHSNTVASFCGCVNGEASVDVAAQGFCKRAADNSSSVTGDELIELKKALKDLGETDDPDDGCCEC